MIQNKIENRLAHTLKMAILFGNIEMPAGIPYNRRCFHGTYLTREEGVFDNLAMTHTDWEAVWISPDETAAEKFATSRTKSDPGSVPAVYEVPISLSTALPIGKSLADEITDEFGVDDLREAIPSLRQMGYDGWITVGAIGGTIYEDVAVFDESMITVDKIKYMKNDSWTSYVPLDKLNGDESIFSSDELERFTRVMHP